MQYKKQFLKVCVLCVLYSSVGCFVDHQISPWRGTYICKVPANLSSRWTSCTLHIRRNEDPFYDCYETLLKTFRCRWKANKRTHSGWSNWFIKSTCPSQNRFWSRKYEGGFLLNLFFVYLMRMHTCLFIFKKVFLYLLLYLIFIVWVQNFNFYVVTVTLWLIVRLFPDIKIFDPKIFPRLSD